MKKKMCSVTVNILTLYFHCQIFFIFV